MADKEEGEEPTLRGNEWEVVSLTASAYAAAPGPRAVEVSDGNENTFEGDDAEMSKTMFMSKHFGFPERDHIEIQKELKSDEAVSEMNLEKGDKSDKKGEQDWDIKGELPGLKFDDEKDNKLSVDSTDFETSATLQGLKLAEMEQNIYGAADYSSMHSETTIGGSITYEMNTDIPEIIESADQSLGFHADVPQSPKSTDEELDEGSDLPCEAWWKRQAVSLYGHAKEANTFWSIFIAAAVMGLVIIGQRLQQDRWQKMGKIMGPISRLKDAIVVGNRPGSFIRGSASG